MASDFSISHAAHIIRNGGVIAYPTDTIYGLGCDPYNADAVEKINIIKQRPRNKQFILLAGDIQQVSSLLNISELQEKVLTRSTEPTSWVVEASHHAPPWLTGNDHTLTIRISNNDLVQRLCKALGHAIVSTSANISGRRPAKNAIELHRLFQHQVDKILVADNPLTGRASKIIRLCDNQVIRQ